MLWKKNWPEIRTGPAPKDDEFFSRVKREVRPVRPPGELPVRDPGSFSRFRCELCTGAHPLGELRQCALCGRWVCSACWTPDYYVCNSCNGIITLHLLGRKS